MESRGCWFSIDVSWRKKTFENDRVGCEARVVSTHYVFWYEKKISLQQNHQFFASTQPFFSSRDANINIVFPPSHRINVLRQKIKFVWIHYEGDLVEEMCEFAMI